MVRGIEWMRGLTRRNYLKNSVKGTALLGIGGVVSGKSSSPNPIETENRKRGNAGWKPVVASNARPSAVDHRIEGYSSTTSVTPGETMTFHVSTKPQERYRVDVFRLGWYDGKGGRLMTSLPERVGQSQSIPTPLSKTGRVECDWKATDTLDVPNDWVSGTYLAKFVLTSGKERGTFTVCPFFVREHPDRNSRSKILVQMPIATAQAYNGWGGKSLYDFTSVGGAADEISFDRPLAGSTSLHLNYAIHLLRFLEREGYDVSYVSDVDIHRNPKMLREHQLVVSAGHDEYWSMQQRNGFKAARDAGTNVAFLAANTALWQVRYKHDGRTMVGYKENVKDDPQSGTQLQTGTFRTLPSPRPESELLGVMGTGAGLYNAPDYSVVSTALDHPWMRKTGFKPDDNVVGVIGHEWDFVHRESDVTGELTRFFHYEAGTSGLQLVSDTDADAVSYQAPSNAIVFSTGTLGWTWRLDPDPRWDAINWPLNKIKEYKPQVLKPDPRLQRFTRNMLDDLQKENPSASGN